MIKFENTEVLGFEHAVRGMRNPMNSWDKSDSRFNFIETHVDELGEFDLENDVELGENDLALMKRLRKAGTDHRKYLRMITVYVDITAPLYWWKEFDTYKVGTVANSCSTMHKIHTKEFTLDDFSHERLRSDGLLYDSINCLKYTINILNFWRERFNESEEDRKKYFEYNGYPDVPSKKECWYQMIQLLPSSYNQKRTVMLNYEVLNNIYKSRKNHKLDEWSIGFMKWIESLPYTKELIIDGEDI